MALGSGFLEALGAMQSAELGSHVAVPAIYHRPTPGVLKGSNVLPGELGIHVDAPFFVGTTLDFLEDPALARNVRNSPLFDGPALLQLATLSQIVAGTTANDFFRLGEVDKRTENRRMLNYADALYYFMCGLLGCKHGGKCMLVHDMLTEEQMLAVMDEIKEPPPRLRPDQHEEFKNALASVVVALGKASGPEIVEFAWHQTRPSPLEFAFPPGMAPGGSLLNQVINHAQAVLVRFCMRVSVQVLNEVSRVESEEELMSIVSRYLWCQCVGSLGGLRCDKCT